MTEDPLLADGAKSAKVVLRDIQFKCATALETARHSRVEEIEPCRLDRLPRTTFVPYGNFPGEEGALEDLEVFLNSAARNLRVGRKGLVVDLLSAGERGDFEKAANADLSRIAVAKVGTLTGALAPTKATVDGGQGSVYDLSISNGILYATKQAFVLVVR